MRTDVVYTCPHCGELPTIVDNGDKMVIQCKRGSQKPHLKIEIEAIGFSDMEGFLIGAWNVAAAPWTMN